MNQGCLRGLYRQAGDGKVIALAKSMPSAVTRLENGLVFDVFRHRLLAIAMDRFDQGFDKQHVVLALIQVADKRAVDFDEIHRQMLEVLEGRKSDAEIIESQLAAERFDAAEQGFCVGELVKRSRFGYFQR